MHSYTENGTGAAWPVTIVISVNSKSARLDMTIPNNGRTILQKDKMRHGRREHPHVAAA